MQKRAAVSELEKRFRQKRFRLLTRLLGTLPCPIRILDLGGATGFWEVLEYAQLGEIQVTLLNRFPQDNLPPGFQSKVGDARCLEGYYPNDFDFVLSNSVIGHVGSFEDQKKMADEIRRVGRRYFIQTPNHFFPVDWRTLIPFFHFLPMKIQAWLLHRFPLAPFGRIATFADALRWASSVRNLTHRELLILFPGATVAREKVLGFTKSFMVYHGFERPSRLD